MAEEFEESDVIFSDQHHQNPPHAAASSDGDNDYRSVILQPERSKSKRSKKKKKKEMANSLPVSIPERISRRTDSDNQLLEEEWEDEGMVPPYVIADRRIAGKMAFSVCTGNGRTLKGRDLSQVRNSILRMTGFLEA